MNTIPVFYRPEMVANAQSFSPSASKPGKVVNSWITKGMPITIRKQRAASREEMCLAHDGRYIDAVLQLRAANGFGTRSREVADSLRFTTGSMVAAAREALKNGQVAAAPCSGFHHAGYDFGGGFCTFNGLMIAAQVMRYEGRARRVAILDLDQHYGNGTDDIIAAQRINWVKHFTSGRSDYGRKDAARFLRDLPQIMREFADCDVLLYQAGADAHVDDPLGGWMTTGQLKTRDRIVFECAKELRLPVAWNLAGGYQKPIEKVLEIHDNTMKECVNAYLENAYRKAA